MALGFDVLLIGVPRFDYKKRNLTAWKRDAPWFDGWELSRDPRMRGDGYPLAGLFRVEEVRQLHARFASRVRGDGTITPTALDAKIISDDEDDQERTWMSVKDVPPPTTVAELDELLADDKLKWVIVELWDRS